jgi:4-hydroxybenzoate polyprenyltransferase
VGNNPLQSIRLFSKLVTLSHSIFALPFACIGFCLGIKHAPEAFSVYKLLLMISCMITARSAAMAFNRYIDRNWDGLNPRTKTRELPSGKLSPGSALGITIVCSMLFIASAGAINSTCFYLSPVALAIILGYSYTKRFTALCHIILGLGLSLAPIGAYLSLTGSFHWTPLLFSVLVLFWVSGFDILYALQDEDFDRTFRLHSIPVLLGSQKAITLSRILHACAALWVFVIYLLADFNSFYVIGSVCFIALLIWQHRLISIHSRERINAVFALTNGFASLWFGILACMDILFYN